MKHIHLTTMLAILTVIAAAPASSEILVDCPAEGSGGDSTMRGFYVTDYPGSTLDQVILEFSASVAGDYTIRLTARENAYDGTLVGVAEVTQAFTETQPYMFPVTFDFAAASATANAILTFKIEEIAVPTDGYLYYNVVTDNPACPVTQTNFTNPPLDSDRRQGICIVIHGTGITPTDAESWSAIKACYR